MVVTFVTWGNSSQVALFCIGTTLGQTSAIPIGKTSPNSKFHIEDHAHFHYWEPQMILTRFFTLDAVQTADRYRPQSLKVRKAHCIQLLMLRYNQYTNLHFIRNVSASMSFEIFQTSLMAIH